MTACKLSVFYARSPRAGPAILAARKLNDIENTPWANEGAIKDAIQKAARILEKIDEKWPGPGMQS